MTFGGEPLDRWSDGDAYEAYVGRWSRLVAREFIAWVGVDKNKRWLDVGAGTGALSNVVVERAAPLAVVGVDASPTYVEAARGRVDDPRVRFEQGDACALRFREAFDAAVSGLMLNFVTDPEAAVTGMRDSVATGGVVAAYVWDYAEGMQFMRYFWDAALEVAGAADVPDEAERFPLCRPDPLLALWERAGLMGAAVQAIDVPTHFADFDDYWSPFLGGQGAAPTYLMSLSERQRDAVRTTVASRLPVAPDGTISLTARAWAVKGHVA